MQRNIEDLQLTLDKATADHEHLYLRFSRVIDHFIVTDSNNNQFYSVQSDSDHMAVVHTGYLPYIFSDVRRALKIARTFKATNGAGPITWQVMSCNAYYELMQPRLENIIKQFREMIIALTDRENEI